MKITIQENKANPLLNRTEVKGSIEFENVTPSNMVVTESLAKETKKDINLIIVKNIYTHFGQKLADFGAVIYDNLEAKEKTEMLTKHIKKKMEEDRKKAEEAKQADAEAKQKAVEEAKAAKEAEAAAKEAPAEETKEEPAAEEKPAEEKAE
jgi:ribosomal protein S24E